MSEIDYSNLTDEELSQIDFSNAQVDWGTDDAQDSTSSADTDANAKADTGTDTDAVATATTTDNPILDPQNQVATTDDSDGVTATGYSTDTDDTTGTDTDTNKSVDEDNTTHHQTGLDDVNYQAFYEEVTKPFKANGRTIQVKNANDMVALMQQGANYSKKMAGLKPSMGILKTLEEHGLNDPTKLAYLVDLYNKKPEAIAKLVKDSQIDLYDFDTDQADNYTPQATVEESSEVGDMISQMSETYPKFRDVLSDVTQYWDDKSKQYVVDNPEILRAMAQQADSGLYYQIMEKLDYERMLGRMTGMPFLQAYSTIEAMLLEQANQSTTPAQQAFTAPRPDQATDPANADKKRKATTPKSGSATNHNLDFDPLKVSDEEFLKYYNQMGYH